MAIGPGLKQTPPGRGTAAALALLAGAVLFFTRALQQPPDGLDYALAIGSGAWIFHPHHLLFAPACRLVMLALQGVGLAVDAVLAAQLHNIVWGVAAAIGCGAAAWEPTRKRSAAFTAAALMLVLRGGWVYSVQVEVYIPAAGALALATALLAGGVPLPMRSGRRTAVAALLAVAVLYHQTNVLFCLPLLAGLSAARGMRGTAEGIWICFVAGLITIGCYAGAYVFQGGSIDPAAFTGWCLGYALEPVPEWGSLSHFSVTGVRDLLAAQGADFIAVPVGLEWPAAVATLVFLVAIYAWHLLRFIGGAARRMLRVLLMTWPLVYFVFFLWWLPSDTDFYVATLPPLILLTVWGGWEFATERRMPAGRVRKLTLAAHAAVVLLAAVNLAFTVLPLHLSHGEDYALAQTLAAEFPAAGIFAGGYGVNQNLRYHFRKNVIDLAEPLRDLYAGAGNPRTPRPEPGATIVADAALVSPGFTVGDRNGLTHPDLWRKAMIWLLAGPTGSAATRQGVRPVSTRIVNGRTYLVLGPTDADAVLAESLARLRLTAP